MQRGKICIADAFFLFIAKTLAIHCGDAFFSRFAMNLEPPEMNIEPPRCKFSACKLHANRVQIDNLHTICMQFAYGHFAVNLFVIAFLATGFDMGGPFCCGPCVDWGRAILL